MTTDIAGIGPPVGTVTFLFTDIEGSTRLWEQRPDAMRTALARHDSLLREAIEQHGGVVFKTVGDAFYAAFNTASEAVAAAHFAQLALGSDNVAVSLRVRMALHTGSAERRDGDYFGPPLNRVARLLTAGHGGQVLLSDATRSLVEEHLPQDTSLRDLGAHRLRDLERPERVFQLLHSEVHAEFPPLRTLENLPNNLPLQLTSFVGRDKELTEALRLLAAVRLLTLTGSGGCGKSRLALQVGADVLAEYADGVWLVELAPLFDPSLIPQTVASVLGIREEPGRPLSQTLSAHLATKSLLLLLDNTEHLLSASAQLVEALLRSCPGVRILVTSREALSIAGETTYRVPSLSLPDPDARYTPESLSQFDAVRLFIDRATTVHPSFTVTNDNAPALAQVCYRLDGIPLAIELAAARVRAMPVEQIASRLDDRFRLLTGGSRTALPRQQTLRALIDWSYNLLSSPERALLSRISVFMGGCDLEAAEQVCSGGEVEDWQVLDLLTSLVDKSLVAYDDNGGTGRYRLLETVRQYARDMHMSTSEAGEYRTKHLSHYVQFAESAEPFLRGSKQSEWFRRLTDEFDNIRAALEWATGLSGEEGSRILFSLGQHWHLNARIEGRSWCARMLTTAAGESRGSSRCRILLVGGGLAVRSHDVDNGLVLLEEAFEIAKLLGDEKSIAQAHMNIGVGHAAARRFNLAEINMTEALVRFERLGDYHRVVGIRNNLAAVLKDQGRRDEARDAFVQCLEECRKLGVLDIRAMCLGNLADMYYADEDIERAKEYKQEALQVCHQMGWELGAAGCLETLGEIAISEGKHEEARLHLMEALRAFSRADDHKGIAHSLESLGRLAAATADYNSAAMLFGAAQVVWVGVASDGSSERPRHDDVRTHLGEELFATFYGLGGSMTLQESVQFALTVQDAAKH